MAKLESGIFAFITTIISVIFTASLSSVASADVLQFGPGALPACAYECVALYSAQYDCPEESSPGECFCTSKHLDALFQGHTPCEDQCPETSGGATIKIWFNSVCVAYLKTSTSLPGPTTTTDSSSPTSTSTTTPKDSHKSNQSADSGNRAVEWWKKNWHWFLIAFLIIIVPITVYALWFPCRKWTRKQIIQRRSRPSLPPVPPVDPTLVYKSHYSNGGLASPTRVTSPGIPPVPIGTFSNQQWADPFSPSLTRDGTGYFPHYVAPPTPSPVGAVRQESWERKVREEFEGKKTLGEKLAFWKKDRKGGEADEEENMER